MPPHISFEAAHDFTIDGANFGTVDGDFTTITLSGPGLEQFIPLIDSHRRRQKRRPNARGQRLQEPITATGLPPRSPTTVAPPPHPSPTSASIARSPGPRVTNPPIPQPPTFEYDGAGPYFSTPEPSPNYRQRTDDLSSLSGFSDLRRFTPSNRSPASTPRRETVRIPYSEVRSSVSEPKTPMYSIGSARTRQSPFEWPRNPSPPYSDVSPTVDYPQHQTRSLNATPNFSSRRPASSSHYTASSSRYSRSRSPPNTFSPHPPLTLPFPSPNHQVHATRTLADLPPAEAVRVHWTSLYPVRSDLPPDVRQGDPEAPRSLNPAMAGNSHVDHGHNNFYPEGSHGYEHRGYHYYYPIHYEQSYPHSRRSAPRSIPPSTYSPNTTSDYPPYQHFSSPPLYYSQDGHGYVVA